MEITIDTHGEEPAYKQLADQLRAAITRGDYAPGDLLPSLKQLSGAHGIAIATVQHALQVLKDEGLIYGVSGRGTFVRRAARPPS